MKKTQIKNLLSFTLCIVLIAAAALLAGCNDNTAKDLVSSGVTEAPRAEVTEIGEGDTKFKFTVIDKDGKETKFEVSTNQTIVGEALLDAELIAGEDGDYGLYVKTVNGITLDFNTDGMYWAFYVNDAYAMSGVDSTEIKSGETYTFKAEK